jgi:SAM-dependent methyltransferase
MGPGSREDWERRWSAAPEGAFDWFLGEQIPPELAETLARDDVPDGAALDVGCGSGQIAERIAERFRPTLGLDISLSAIRIGRERRPDGVQFLVAASPDFPFRDDAFAFIFDRGCLQHVPRTAWPRYFDSIRRMLRPGGLAELLVPGQLPPSPLSLRGIRAHVAKVRGRRGSSRLVSISKAIRQHVPSELRVELVATNPVQMPSGADLLFTHALIRRLPRS